MEYDKINDKVGFNEAEHIYEDINTKDRYISVTTLIHEYCQPFDTVFQSKKKALERLAPELYLDIKREIANIQKITPAMLEYCKITDDELEVMRQVILGEWKVKSDEACIRGTAYHLEQEMALYNKTNNTVEFDKDYYCVQGDMSIMNQEVGIFPEFLIYYEDKDLRIAGQIDVLIKDGNTIQVQDYKTNAKINRKGFFNTKTKKTYKMQAPLNDLDDCNLNHYTLQLSLYAWMVNKKYPELTVGDLKILHVDHDGKKETIQVPYLKTHVEKMINHYKRKMENKKLEEFLNSIS